ncbi:MAG: ABC transporter substrate-binding protein [Lachnospiraceae bacterium]|nr:ABC transporter substrate-binding protein [Lachnospiraceae bacterium]
MKLMKKIAALGIASVLTMSLITGCGSKSEESSEDKVYKIGVTQYVEHDALDAAYEGFVDGLEEAGYKDGENIEIDLQNAQADQSNCQTIASKLVKDDKDLILAIATPAAQAVANETKDIPILVTAVTDPADAKLVESNEEPGTNVSGTSDLTPCKEQMELLTQLVPDAKKVAMLYCSAEANSKFQIEMAKEAAKELDLETVDATVADSNEIEQVVKSLKGKVDAIYSPTDNVIAAGMTTVSMVADEIGIPVIVGEEGMCSGGGLATYGIDYYKLGQQTAEMAVKVLEGEDISKMPIEYQENCELIINKDTVEKLKVKVPEDLDKEARYIETITEAESEE